MENQTFASGHEAFRIEQSQLAYECRKAITSSLFDAIERQTKEMRAESHHDIGVLYELADLMLLMKSDGLNYSNWYRSLSEALERMGCEVSEPNADEKPEAPEAEPATMPQPTGAPNLETLAELETAVHAYLARIEEWKREAVGAQAA